MTVDDQPIGYELTDAGADPDGDHYPVDSTYHRCCSSIGRHSRECKDELPAGAITASEWRPAGDGEFRTFYGEAVKVFEMSDWLSLRSVGYQFRGGDNDGFIARTVELLCDGLPIRPAGINLLSGQAENLATALSRAALTVDQLSFLDGVGD